jgi:ParD-like antitoxin of type II bacterial toxin-antitoxin system
MGMPVKLSDELVAAARKEAASADRSITGQIEHWATIGRSVERVLRHQDVQALKGSPADVTLTVSARRALQAVLKRLVTETGRGTLASRLKAGRVVYQSDPAGSGLTERVSPDGTRTLGRLANRRFIPARAPRSRGR